MSRENPLVSVCVVTYNSSEFIIETLESIKKQTYSNIELIISDDCSSDDTIDVCKQWIDECRNLFVNVLLITTPANTGTAGNANRGLAACHGEWVKYIGGDDILLPDAIENYYNYVKVHRNVFALFSDCIEFRNRLEDNDFRLQRVALRNFAFRKSITAQSQHRILSKTYFGLGATFFCAKKVLVDVGGFDERFPLIDDYPLFIKITKYGYKLHLIPIVAVYKRVHIESVSHARSADSIYSKAIVLCVNEYKLLYKRESLDFFWRVMLSFSIFLYCNVISSGNTNKSLKCKIYYYIQRLFDPFNWYSKAVNILDLVYSIFGVYKWRKI